MVNLNEAWLRFVFVLISFVDIHGIIWRRGVRLKLDVESQESGRNTDVDGEGGGESCKLDNFHECHMCVIPCLIWEKAVIKDIFSMFQVVCKRCHSHDVIHQLAVPVSNKLSFTCSPTTFL